MDAEHLVLTDYSGDPNLGFHGVATDEYAVLAPDFKRKEVLGLDNVHETYIANTDLAGLFCAGNSSGLLVPDTISEYERSNLDDAGIESLVVEANHTALGNLVLANDAGAYLSPHLQQHEEAIAEFLDVETRVGTVAGLSIVGSAGVATNSGVLLHREADEEELSVIEELLDVEGDIGTVNFGSPYVGSGIVANATAALVGNETKGPETGRIEKALGFLQE
ncbi:MAG: translation initiation factor IF-6 [Candidatus Nanohaloarchaea archaeon]|nr:translation initiation factor IF-6 [Candidatus Nanohaloarchaea archaeon]